MLALLLGAARAADPWAPPVWFIAGVGAEVGLADAPGGGGGVNGGVGVSLAPSARDAVGLEARLREGWVSGETRQIGGIGFIVRYPSRPGPYGFVGFAHHHESAIADALARPVATALGIDDAITHRTGFEVGAGWDFPSPQPDDPVLARVLPRAALTAVVLPDRGGPPVYVLLEGGFRVGVGRLPNAD